VAAVGTVNALISAAHTSFSRCTHANGAASSCVLNPSCPASCNFLGSCNNGVCNCFLTTNATANIVVSPTNCSVSGTGARSIFLSAVNVSALIPASLASSSSSSGRGTGGGFGSSSSSGNSSSGAKHSNSAHMSVDLTLWIVLLTVFSFYFCVQ